MTSKDLKKMKIIDGIIKEPLGGAHNDIDLAAKKLKKVIIEDEIRLINETKKEFGNIFEYRIL